MTSTDLQPERPQFQIFNLQRFRSSITVTVNHYGLVDRNLARPLQTPPRPEFYTLLLQVLSNGTLLAVKRQTWCGTALTC